MKRVVRVFFLVGGRGGMRLPAAAVAAAAGGVEGAHGLEEGGGQVQIGEVLACFR